MNKLHCRYVANTVLWVTTGTQHNTLQMYVVGFTDAAPVISISIITYSCHQSLSATVAPSSTSYPFSIQPTYRSYNSHPSSARKISIITYSCHQSLSTTVASSSIGPQLSIQPTCSSYNSHPSSARIFSASKNISVSSNTILSSPTVANVPSSMIYHIGLISGVITASFIVCTSIATVTIIFAIVISKRCRKIVTMSNQAYGELH